MKVAAKAAANADYSVGVYSLAASPQVMQAFVARLHDVGYTVIKAQALAQREPWLSAHTAVPYHDDAARPKAQWIAGQLQASGVADVAIAKGSGTGLAASHVRRRGRPLSARAQGRSRPSCAGAYAACTSRCSSTGVRPNRRLNSRLNCDALS